MAVIDLNADLGEGFDDDGLLHIVTSANVACGFHAGDPATMRRVCSIAATRGVAIGAHVSYRDRENFGRVALKVSPEQLIADLCVQIELLSEIAREAGTAVRYVKPHGALYNVAAWDRAHADAITRAVSECDPSLALLGLYGTQLDVSALRRDLSFVSEAFVDRAYLANGQLVPRDEPHAIHEGAAAVAQALSIAREGTVQTSEGDTIKVQARSLCLHGDGTGAVELAAQIRDALIGAGLELRSFADA